MAALDLPPVFFGDGISVVQSGRVCEGVELFKAPARRVESGVTQELLCAAVYALE